ncbi:tetratricopeptide repeat protein [Aeromonas simiae]|uniref:tetratricopeptide repeat protein n=1 Tax=Aeromonas simiae TaxID=218936 RepID=UPI0038D204BD
MLRVKHFSILVLNSLFAVSFVNAAADKTAMADDLYQQAVIPWEQGRSSGWELMLKAADAGNTEAMCLIANSYMTSALVSSKESDIYFERAAKAGGLCGMLALSDIGVGPILSSSLTETNGSENWSDKVVAKSKSLAEKDDLEGIKTYAFIYAARKDYNTYCKWLERAAKLGDADSMNKLSGAIRDGCGWYIVPGSRDKAVHHWIEQSAHHGNPRAMEKMAGYAREKLDFPMMFSWLEKAANTGNFNSIRLISSYLMGGSEFTIIVPENMRDNVKAYGWLYTIVQQLPEDKSDISYAATLEDMAKLEKVLLPEELNKAKSWANEWMKTHQVRSYFLEFGM